MARHNWVLSDLVGLTPIVQLRCRDFTCDITVQRDKVTDCNMVAVAGQRLLSLEFLKTDKVFNLEHSNKGLIMSLPTILQTINMANL